MVPGRNGVLVGDASKDRTFQRLNSLTVCERAAVELVLGGCSNSDAARARGISLNTLAGQLGSAYRKLGVGGRRELRATAIASLHSDLRRGELTRELSSRERQILTLSEQGHANKVVASILGIAISTVSTLLTRARRKLHEAQQQQQQRFLAGSQQSAEPPQKHRGYFTL
jgi:DNA-binding CsgD family transcriptional regulator